MHSTLPILMYHSLGTAGPRDRSDPLTVPRSLIDDQWSALRGAGWRLRGLTEALDEWAVDPSARIVGITFDDGRADFIGVPDLLAAHDATATLYVPTAHLGGDGAPVNYVGRVLDWDELADLPHERVEIGSHAHHHLPVDIHDDAALGTELRTSRDLLEQRLGRPVRSFCYPNGYASAREAQAVARAGYENACVVGRRVSRWSDDLYLLPRLQVGPTYDGPGVVALVEQGEGGLATALKPAVHPVWRRVRRAVYRHTGKVLT